MDATQGNLPVACHATSPKTTEIRNQLSVLYEVLIPVIALSVAQALPPSFDKEDLAQTGRMALLEAAPAIDSYVRRRIFGAMQDSIKGRKYKDSTHLGVEALPDPEDPVESVEDDLIKREETQAVQKAIATLPPDQAKILRMMSGELPAPRGRRWPAHQARKREAIDGFRMALAA
jgi:DNA-directed RNA polymerase specialized sigma24 family protein